MNEALDELASIEIQRSVWLHPTSERVGTLDEAWEQLFDDSLLIGALDRGTSGLAPPVVDLLRLLNARIRAVDQDQPYAAMIESSAMDAVRDLASRIRAHLASG
ncbi:MAG TPA: hypothetical protein VF228_07930 [Iamia sp.]